MEQQSLVKQKLYINEKLMERHDILTITEWLEIGMLCCKIILDYLGNSTANKLFSLSIVLFNTKATLNHLFEDIHFLFIQENQWNRSNRNITINNTKIPSQNGIVSTMCLLMHNWNFKSQSTQMLMNIVITIVDSIINYVKPRLNSLLEIPLWQHYRRNSLDSIYCLNYEFRTSSDTKIGPALRKLDYLWIEIEYNDHKINIKRMGYIKNSPPESSEKLIHSQQTIAQIQK